MRGRNIWRARRSSAQSRLWLVLYTSGRYWAEPVTFSEPRNSLSQTNGSLTTIWRRRATLHSSQIWLKSPVVAAERKGFPYDALQKIMDISKHGRLMLTGSLQWERNTPNGKTHRFAERLRYPAQILNRARYRTVQLWWRPRNVIFLTGSG